ncbi:MAG TPA: DUF4388 domain-containing protein [Thermoanaerobaculia bacterium]|nr:DUF4388 domain-containing protein [Thermoanaerobaculia bacterium]
MNTELPAELQAALFDIQRYLLDEIPPLTASEAVEELMAQPPELLMKLIRAWAVEQSRVQPAAMCDFLFHALRKIHMVSALNLVEEKALEAYLSGVIPLALQACPAEERELLRSNLAGLRDSRSFTVAPVEMLPRERGGGGARDAAPVEPVGERTANIRRFSLVVDRLSRSAPAASRRPGAAAGTGEHPVAQLVTMAAASASSDRELARYIESIRPYTGNVPTSNLFTVLAEGIAPWNIAMPAGAGARVPAPVEAMHRIITLTRDPMESTNRFRELVGSAVEQFNAGSLTAAASMLDLADVVVVEKKIDPSTAARIREAAVDGISSEQLKKYEEDRIRHPLLRKVLGSFPSLTVEGLLGALRGEHRPERRRALLALLEAWGTQAREAALRELEIEMARPPDEVVTYYVRNMVYLLHRIPREPGAPVEKELTLLTRASIPGESIWTIKEAMIPIGQIHTDASVRLLAARLAEFENLLIARETSIYAAIDLQKVLDRIVAALARIGTPAALLTIARHGMKTNPLLGDTRGRLSLLGQHDLSFDDKTVDLLVTTIREDLPKRFLGRIVPKRQPPPVRLIEALAGTGSEIVESLFREIAAKYPDQDVGIAATAALANLNAAGSRVESSPATLTGDLQFFGLPSLVQSLADTKATGIVTLTNREFRQTVGKLLFVEGKFADAQFGHLRGVDALYQMLERPVVGMFSFVPQPAGSAPRRGELHEVMGLLFEGIRRHDELKQASMVVPDELRLKAGSVKPTPDPEESDATLMHEVWMKAMSGAPAGEWERQIPTDAFRARRLAARWVEEGSLQPA